MKFEENTKKMVALATAAFACVTPKTRVIMVAQLLSEVLKMFTTLDNEEVVAALKTALVVRSVGFTIAQKAVVESLMSRDLLTEGLDEAFKRSL